MTRDGASRHSTKHKCVGIVEEVMEKREEARNKPQPWIVRKLAVFMSVAIIGYAWYVYVGRFCVSMIRRDPEALGSRGMGIGFLVVFCILGLMTMWAYEKILLTSPGLAKHSVQKTPAPIVGNAVPTWWESQSEENLAAARYLASVTPPQPPPPARSRHLRSESRHSRVGSQHKSVQELHGSIDSRRKGSQNGHARVPSKDENAGITDALPPVAAAKAKTTAEEVPPPHVPHVQQAQVHPEPLPGTASAQKPMMYTRKPSQTPILLPQYRYCHKDGFQKPLRAHHCRACGTCVLRYDHHCPWIGQCVGARNHRFFMIFVFWALILGSWVFSTLVGLNARASISRPNFEVDPQKIAVIVLSGFFCIFTAALLVTHTFLLTNNMTTVEQMAVQRMRERESRVLGRLHSWWQFREKKATVRQWDAEWGRIGKEGHMWWLGSARKNWELTMGDKVWMWFLPIGKSPDDGLTYVVNPRFDKEGRWLPRSEWPAELR